MAKISKKSPKKTLNIPKVVIYRTYESLVVLLIAAAIFLLVALITHHNNDASWSYATTFITIKNWGGKVGAYCADLLLLGCGYMAFVLPVLLLLLASQLWRDFVVQQQLTKLIAGKSVAAITLTIVGIIMMCCSGSALLANFIGQYGQDLPARSGGIIGLVINEALMRNLNYFGSTLLLIACFLASLTFTIGISWLMLTTKIIRQLAYLVRYLWQKKIASTNYLIVKLRDWEVKDLGIVATPVDKTTVNPTKRSNSEQTTIAGTDKLTVNLDKVLAPLPVQLANNQLPDINLLKAPQTSLQPPCLPMPFADFGVLIEQRLLEFGIAVNVTAFYPGPVITRFELALAPGVKVNKITALAKDLARSLSVASVRVVEVIPGKAVIGLEVANQNRETVALREILASKQYYTMVSPVALGLGKDIAGVPIIVDLAKMPHLLVAGTTGSGKSVSVNAMLLSMLYKATPAELRFILIDPKMLELSIYSGIPHLLTPVITDMNDATNALRWCVNEMDKRYKLMSYLGVRNLAGYNLKISEALNKGQGVAAPEWYDKQDQTTETLPQLPLIVVVADELADLIMVVGKKIEELIVRLAQKARAAGIHLILATQRPSVDVITGLIKANVPTRIAFQVSSRIDSRTILDQQGAEQLLGYGDMLYLPAGAGIPLRVHGAYVSDEEVHDVVAAWQKLAQPEYISSITAAVNDDTLNTVNASDNTENDPLYDQAVFIVTESRRASISLVQRRLRIGYNRAARLMETMEAAGLVSTMDSSGNRQVLAAAPPTAE